LTEAQVRQIVKEELGKLIKYASALPENARVPKELFPNLAKQQATDVPG
jgi:hypothetical protein